MSTQGNLTSVLLTDWYQLSMLDAYYRLGLTQTAVFEFFVRRLPKRRSFLIAAGLDQVLEYLDNVRFTAEEIAWLESTKHARLYCAEQLARCRQRIARWSTC